MEYCYQYNSVSNVEKEKRPPLRRGSVKLQIVKTLSNLVAPSNNKRLQASGSQQLHKGTKLQLK
ncbi:unnamed protein product [Miscanthus lutarioriparius]|uniref:Uncharacterized protein n=1 Tax=Miscanthus lutarioriparius TaxID=422564 RepID=A0A811SHP0_9POAL|nr:unnamed protein product [Miscanthus lutarioriparius]